MIYIFRKSQLPLFDTPVQIAAHVRKDGSVVKPHVRIMKVGHKPAQASLFAEHEKPAPAKKRTKLDAFIDKKGGAHALASVMSSMSEEQRNALYAAMAKLDGSTPEAVAARFVGAEKLEPQRGSTPDLFSAPSAAVEPDQHGADIDVGTIPAEAEPAIVEHVTGRGKTLRGIVRTDLTADQAKEIDPYTFRKDGGWFIREKHLNQTPVKDETSAAVDSDPVSAEPIKQTDLIAAAVRKNQKTEPFGVPAGISKAKRREINQAASDIIHSGQELTDADRATLRQYSGNGGCGDSLNEFYTGPEVAAAMWTMLGKLGVTSGTVLEPSCATGVFMHTAPETFKVTGVEMDPTSAAIAEALHGDRHEIINSSLERFATTSGDRQFSAVIGNAPFGIRGSLIKDDKSELKTAEGYFLDTALDKTVPGGIVAMIVPTGVMDSRSARSVRQRLMCKGEFLGAVRMPNTAFEHSHTEVTTDIVYFRKRADDVAGALMALDKTKLKQLGVWDDEYLSGSYFEGRGEPNIFGTMEAGWRAKAGIGQDITVSGSMIGVADSVAAWQPDEVKTASPSVADILAACGDDEKLKRKVMAGAVRQDNFAGKAGDTKTEDGVTYILQGKPLRWHRLDEFTQTDAVTDAQLLARDIDAAVNGGSREGLAERVQDFIEKHGNPAKNKNLLIAASQDRVLYRLIGAVSPDGTLSDVVSGRDRKIEGSLDTAAQSLAAEHEAGTFTVAELAERMGKDEDDVEDMLFASSSYAYSGDGKWTPMDRYLTGELWGKLDHLKAEIGRGELREGLSEKYALQAKRLEETIDPKSLEDAEVMLNSAFLPLNVLEAYFNERKAASENQWVRDRPDVSITFKDSWYTVEGGDHNVQNQLAKYLNRDGVRKDDMHIIEDWNTDFKEWLLSSSYRDQVENLYNRAFRGFVQAEFSDAAIVIPGMNTDGLKQYQYSGLRWALAAGKGIIAADVGLGKTVRGLMLARMAKVNGTAKRPTFVVPKSVLANWVAEAEKWFPGSRVLVVGETYTRDKDGNLKSKSDSAAERNRKLHEMTQNDYDFIFISQPAFNDIDLDPIIKGQYVNDDFWVQRGDKKGNEGDKKLKKIREAYEQAVANREFQKRTDAAYWDQLGIDMMVIDEGHCFPAGTLIDGKAIEEYKAGDTVLAFDHATGKVVNGKVANLQVRRPASLYKVVLSDGAEVVCTGKHPFFTQRGYIFAEELRTTDTVYKNLYNNTHEDKRLTVEERGSAASNCGVEVSQLRNSVQTEQGAGLEQKGEGAIRIFLRKVVRYIVAAYASSNEGCNQGGERQQEGSIQGRVTGACVESQSHAEPRNEREGKRYSQRKNVQAALPWWKRAWSYCASIIADKCTWARMGNGISHNSTTSERQEFGVQTGYSEQVVHDCDRSGWTQPRYDEAETNRPPQGESLVGVGLDRIEVFQREGDGTFGRLCPGGVVYNIEVEQYHNYFAFGVLVHNSYKNLFAAKNRFGDAPKFLGGQGQSNRAFDMNMKTRFLREHNGGKGVFMLTATPTKNSPLEIYSMLSHVAPEAFERIGIRNSEEFLDRFCTFVSDKVLTTSGTIEDALVTDGFKNLDELREIMRRYIDRKTAADVGLVLPSRNDQMHLIDMSDKQQEVYAGLRQDMIDSAKEKDATGDSHVFSIMDKMGKAAMDLELLDENVYAGEASPKYAESAKHIVAGAKDGGQVVFAESVKSHQKLLEALVKAGIPRDQIAIINASEAESSAKRQNIADAFNAGKLKVVIGNTATMGEGINLQKATTDIHHLDLPWDPASMQQRNGRGLRQGNVNESVRIHTYLSKGSFDGYRYQSMMAKKDWQDMLWNGGDTVENLGRAGKFDRSDLMIMMSADPESERAKYEADKAAATERFDTEKRREVAVEFKRIQLMKQSYGALKNKKSDSAERLRFKLEQAKTKLANNRYFTAKDALNSKTDVVLEPDSGLAIMSGVGLEIAEKDGTTEKWVVSGVNAVNGDVTMRRWGKLGRDGAAMTVPVAKLAGGVKPYQFDAAAESAHVAAKLEEESAAKMNSITDWKDIQAMPSSVLEANHDLIQRQVKEGVKSYKFNMPYGNVPMIDKETGEVEVMASYTHHNKHDTHDYWLPTDANKQKLDEAWMKARRESRISTQFQSGKRGKSTTLAKREYKGAPHDSRHENPFSRIINNADGYDGYSASSPKIRALRNRMEAEQIDVIKHAKTIEEAVRAIFPTASVSGSQENYGDDKLVAKYPQKALTMLWAKARKLGGLNRKMDEVSNGQHSYAVSGRGNETVHNALVAMAIRSGHRDLAEAMLESGKKHNPANDHAGTVRVLGHGFGHSKKHLEMLQHHADKAGLLDLAIGSVAHSNRLTGVFQPNSYSYGRDSSRTFREVLNEKMQEANRKEAA